MTYQAKVIAGGKMVIPAELRRELGIKDGDSLVIDRDASGGLIVRTYSQVVSDVQSRFRVLRGPDAQNTDVVDELIAERRREARREAAVEGAEITKR